MAKALVGTHVSISFGNTTVAGSFSFRNEWGPNFKSLEDDYNLRWMRGPEHLENDDLRCILTAEAYDILHRLLFAKHEVAVGAFFKVLRPEATPYFCAPAHWLDEWPEQQDLQGFTSARTPMKEYVDPVPYPFPEKIDLSKRTHWYCKIRGQKYRTAAVEYALGHAKCPTDWTIRSCRGEGTGKTLSAAVIEAEFDLTVDMAGIEDV